MDVEAMLDVEVMTGFGFEYKIEAQISRLKPNSAD